MTKTPDTEVKKRNTSDGSFFLKHESRKICMAKHKRGIIKKASKNEQILPILGPLKFDFHAHKKRASTCPLREKIATKMPESDE